MKLPSRTFLLTYSFPFLIGGLVWIAYVEIGACSADAILFYQDKMRASLFAGFLTLGSFLLSLKTGIVIKIKENVYDQAEYQALVALHQSGGSKTTFYGPLHRLSRMLAAAVLSAIVASVLQLTIGLIHAWWAPAVCLTAAAIAITFLLFAFALIQLNMHHWFTYLEEQATKKMQKKKLEL